jgi:hypothetical protein
MMPMKIRTSDVLIFLLRFFPLVNKKDGEGCSIPQSEATGQAEVIYTIT